MRKTIAMSVAMLATMGSLYAQVENRAIKLSESATVDCGGMPTLDNLKSYSLQFWLNPENWTENSKIMSRGESFCVKLGKPGEIIINSGGNSLTLESDELKPSEWNQVTLICNNGSARILLNNNEIIRGTLSEIPADAASFILGGGYAGLLDEMRIWDDALDTSMRQFDYFTFNTLNKWCPMWDNLVAYYKMDQKECPYLVDYKGIENPDKGYDNHGILSDGVTRVAANNDKMPYLVNAAYTENNRFYDRFIPQDQYLLSNEIIILGADCVAADGSIKVKTPNNHATLHGGVKAESNIQGREDVLWLDGKAGSYLEAPASSITKYKVGASITYTNTDLNNYTFEARLLIDKWQPNAYLFKKENEDGQAGFSLYLGEEENTLTVRLNGKCNTSVVLENFKPGDWNHIAIAASGRGTGIDFYVNGQKYAADTSKKEIENISLLGSEEFPVLIGTGLEGYLDDVFFSNMIYGSGLIQNHCNQGISVPSVKVAASVENMSATGFFYNFDDPENPGFSSHSQDNILKQIRKQYEGYQPAHVVLSVRGHGSADNPGAEDEFNLIMNDAAKREVFATQLAELSKEYDGVELDLEWVYNAAGWSNYNNLSQAIIDALPEGKTFRISTHNVTYNYPKGDEGIDSPGITGFTFQQYGPQKAHFSYKNGFVANIEAFLKYGYPANKIMSSYSTTTSKGDKGSAILGVKGNILSKYEISDADVDTYSDNKDTWYYMGPMQVYNRAKYTRENNLQGIFYWDMGNDYWLGTDDSPEMPEFNQAKYCSYALNSNIDRIITNLNINHYAETNSITTIEQEGESKNIKVGPSPAENEIKVYMTNGYSLEKVLIYSLSGALMIDTKETLAIDVSSLSSGVYLLAGIDSKGRRHETKFIKR